MKYSLPAFLVCLFSLSAWAQNPPTGFSATTLSPTSINVDWTEPTTGTNVDGFVVVVSTGTPNTFADGDAMPAANDTDATDGDGVFVVNNGESTTNYNGFTLSPGTQYSFRVYSYIVTDASANPDIADFSSALNGTGYTRSLEPGAHAASFTSTLTGADQIDLSFSAVNTITDADGYIILRRAGSVPSTSGVIDGDEPDDLTMPVGTTIVATITDPTSVDYSDAGLIGGITYHYLLIPFNYDGTNDETYNYKKDATIPTTSQTTTVETTLALLTGGVATSPLGSGATNQAILGFSVASNASTDFTAINIQLSSTPSGKITNPRLYLSGNTTWDGPEPLVTGATVVATASEFQISGFTESFSWGTTKYYFLVVDIEASVNASTPQLQPSFTQANVTMSSGTVESATITGTNYSFADIIPPSITARTPINNATGVSVSLNQVAVTFNEEVINAGDNSNDDNRIRIFNDDAGPSLHESIDPQAAGRVTISGASNNIVTITLTTPLAAGTEYSVRIGNSVFTDVAGNPFSGTNSGTAWDFTVESAPNITGYSADPTCVGESIDIQGTDFGAAPAVTVNGVTATINSSSPTVINIVIPNTTSGDVIVTNTNNGLSDTDGSLTIKPAIALSLPISANPPSPAVGQDYDIEVNNTQTTVNYRIREVPSAFSGTTTGTGGTLSFGPYNKASAGSFQYEIQAQSSGCTSRVYGPFLLTIAELQALAGTDKIICSGEDVTLGGSPTATGGTTYYNVVWTTTPPSAFTSTASNPVVSPATTTNYVVTVKDAPSGTPARDTIQVTVNQPENPSNMAILLNPSKPNNTYLNTDSPVDLSYTVNSVPGTFTGNTRFEGVGVNPFTNKFYPSAASLGVNTITLSYENAAGCITEKNVKVEVRDQNAYVTGLNSQYCEKNENINLSINTLVYYPPALRVRYNYVTGLFELVAVNGYKYTYKNDVRLKDYLTGNPIGSPAFSFTGSNMTINTNTMGSYYKYFEILYTIEEYAYNSLDPANPILVGTRDEYVQVYFYVIQKPQLFDFIPSQICENASTIALNVSPSGGSFELNGSFNGPTFDPSADGLPDHNTITYTYTDPGTTCTNSFDHLITINRLPEIAIDFTNGCVDEVIEITPQFNNPTNIPFDYFFDTDGLPGYETAIAGNTSVPIQRTYSVPSNYPINLQVITNAGCVAETNRPLTIGQVPDLEMLWANVCDGDNTRFSFKSNFYKNNINDIESIAWNFDDGNVVNKTNPVHADSVYQHLFGATGYYKAFVTITTDLNCEQTDTVQVYKVAKTGPIGASEYFADFNEGSFEAQGWKSGGTNSSWAWGIPGGTLINDDATPGSSAWVTNLTGTYNSNEDSWVHSPCVDLSVIERPVLSFDLRSLTRDQVDGAVLQYNTKGTTNKESDWKTLGAVGTGKNWYNRIGIGANPGNQSLLQAGWTGSTDSTDWRTAIIPLDNMLAGISVAERDKVRFRLAFGSADFTPEGEGFAFDNFRIAQRDRLVLLEQFTNSGGANTGSEPNKVANQAINTFMSNSFGEVMKLEYHLGVSGPNADPIYQDNPVDANARAAYYGVSSTPTAFVDARFGNLANIFVEQTLKSTDVTIDEITTPSTPAELLNIEVTFTAKNTLPANTVLHVAVIEKEITHNDALGSNGETSFKYVMKKMLPNALGTRYTTPILAGTTETVNVAWAPEAYALENLAIVVFVQNETTKEIYQSAYAEPTYTPTGIVTGMEPELASRIAIYPNPADGELNVMLPERARQNIPAKLIDSFGRDIHQTIFKTGEHSKTIPTKELAGGVYILQLDTKDGVVRKKVMVVH